MGAIIHYAYEVRGILFFSLLLREAIAGFEVFGVCGAAREKFWDGRYHGRG